MVVVVVYAPDAQYDALNKERGDNSQRLGQRAATIVEGTVAAKWKPGKPMPRPTAEQLKHPKRLLFSDLIEAAALALRLQATPHARCYGRHEYGSVRGAQAWEGS